jgi:hypothetical protein
MPLRQLTNILIIFRLLSLSNTIDITHVVVRTGRCMLSIVRRKVDRRMEELSVDEVIC